MIRILTENKQKTRDRKSADWLRAGFYYLRSGGHLARD